MTTQSNTITSVDLSSCRLGSLGASRMAGAMAASSTLTELNLAFNGIDDVGADTLAKAMPESRRLTTLDLVGNNIGVAGAEQLLEGLQLAERVTGLSLHGNPRLGRAVQKKLEAQIAMRRPEEYRRATSHMAPIRRPATLPPE